MARSKDKLKEPDMLAKYGFIYKGFKERYYYWEIYIVGRKIAIICVAVFLFQIDRAIQALVCFAIFFLSYRLQELHRPYQTRALNALEVRSLFVGLVTIYCGLFFLTGDMERTTQLILLIVLVGFNLYFLLYWFMRVFESLPSHLKESTPGLYAKLQFLHRFNTPASMRNEESPAKFHKSHKISPEPVFSFKEEEILQRKETDHSLDQEGMMIDTKKVRIHAHGSDEETIDIDDVSQDGIRLVRGIQEVEEEQFGSEGGSSRDLLERKKTYLMDLETENRLSKHNSTSKENEG